MDVKQLSTDQLLSKSMCSLTTPSLTRDKFFDVFAKDIRTKISKLEKLSTEGKLLSTSPQASLDAITKSLIDSALYYSGQIKSELKYRSIGASSTVNAGIFVPLYLNDVAQGSGPIQRTGFQITIRRIDLRYTVYTVAVVGQLNTALTSYPVRTIIFVDKVPSADAQVAAVMHDTSASPTASMTSVFTTNGQTGANTICKYNPNTIHRYHPLYNHLVDQRQAYPGPDPATLTQVGGGTSSHEWLHDCNITSTYFDVNATDLASNALFIGFLCDKPTADTSNLIAVRWQTTVWYEDN